MRKLYARGINIAAQINSTRVDAPDFIEIPELAHHPISKIGCGYLQSYFFLADGQLLKRGYIMDSLTSIRLFNFNRMFPSLLRFIQKLKYFNELLTFRGGDEELTLLNKPNLLEKERFVEAFFGVERIYIRSDKGLVYGVGQNYYNQLGTGNNIHFECQVSKIQINKQSSKRIKEVGCGFNHTLLLAEDGTVYGCGRTENFQIQPEKYWKDKPLSEIVITKQILEPELVYRQKVVKRVACGYKHSIMLTLDNEVVCLGSNLYGQCGMPYFQYPEISRPTMIKLPDSDVVDIACGFNHTLILTETGLYFMGSTHESQNPYSRFDENICYPELLEFPARPIKIFTQFDRSAVICEDGKAYIFGGRDLSRSGGESGKLEVIDRFTFTKDSLIGLGLGHTIIYP